VTTLAVVPEGVAGEHDLALWQQTYAQISDLLVSHLGVTRESLAPHVRLDEDLAIDSLDLLDLGTVLSDRLRVDLGVEVLVLAQTLADLTCLVTAARAPTPPEDA